MKERLTALAAALQRISDNYGIASQWQPDYNAARVELDGIIADADQIMAPPPDVVQQIITPDTITALSAQITASLIGDICEARDAMIAELKASENAVLAAVTPPAQTAPAA